MSTNSSGHEVIDGADEVSSSKIEVTGQDEVKHNKPSDNSENLINKTPLPPPRRSKRNTKPPQWMQDGEYAVNMVCRAMLKAVLDKTYSTSKSIVFNIFLKYFSVITYSYTPSAMTRTIFCM